MARKNRASTLPPFPFQGWGQATASFVAWAAVWTLVLAAVLRLVTWVVSCPTATPRLCNIWESYAGVGMVPIVVGVLEVKASCRFLSM